MLEKLEKEFTPGNCGTRCRLLSPTAEAIVCSTYFFMKVFPAPHPVLELSYSCVSHWDLLKSWCIFCEVSNGYSSFSRLVLGRLTVRSTDYVRPTSVSILMLLRGFLFFLTVFFKLLCWNMLHSAEICRVRRQ